MVKYIFIIGTILSSLGCNAQIMYWQETLHGGSTMAGVTGFYGFGDAYFSIHYPSESTLKKAFLIVTNAGNPNNTSIVLNDQLINIDQTSVVSNNFASIISQPILDTSSFPKIGEIHAIDITDFVEIEGENYHIFLNQQIYDDPTFPFALYTHYFIWALYEDESMPLTSSALLLNSQNVSPVWQYSINNIPEINSNDPVSLTFISSVLCDDYDGSYVIVNDQNFGLCYGPDFNNPEFVNYCSGTSGSYYYENNTLNGFGDDTPDDTVNNADALADIKEIIPNGSSNLLVKFPYYEYFHSGNSANIGNYTNSIWALALAYTPYECEVLPVNITSDTAICLGSSVTLTAGGGTDYFWQSSMGSLGVLDSTTNSITVSPTTTTSYTVRIEAEGFCPEVRPVQVVVHKIPEPQITSTTSTCGDAVGNIEVTFPYCFCDEFSVAFNNQTPTLKDTALSPINFSNLATGVYPITITDNIGCSWSGNTFVADTNITVAAFTVEPSSGIEPLQVNLNNNSNHATNYEWSINGEITFDENPTFDTAGFYNIQLIAYNNLPECADTAQFTLFVEPAFEVAVPNVFSPNNDNKNDAFIIDFSRVTSFTIVIYNRWGQQVHTLSKEIAELDGFAPRHESIQIWDGKDATDGIYYYTLQVTNNYKNYPYKRQPKFKELTGTVTIVR